MKSSPRSIVGPVLQQILQTGPVSASLELFLGSCFAAVFVLKVIGRVDHAALLWPISGVAVALCLAHWQRGWLQRTRLLLSAAAGFCIAACLVGMPFHLALLISALTCLDALIAVTLLAPAIRTFDDLKHQASIWRFLLAVTVAPSVTATLGACSIAYFLKQPLFQSAEMAFFGNSLGMAIVIPFLLLAKQRLSQWRRLSFPRLARGTPQAFAAVILFTAVSVSVFWQSTYPLLFLILPPLIVMLLVFGLEGAVFTSITITSIGWYATTHGHGPLLLVRDVDLLQRLLLLQVFSWVCMASALPIGALLDERRRAEKSKEDALSEKSILAEELKASRHLFQSFIENSPTVTFIKDAAGRYVFYNQKFATVFGIERNAWIGLSDHDVFDKEDADTYRAHDVMVMNTGQVTELIEQVPDPGGEMRVFKSVKFAYQDVEGQKLLAGSSVDITDEVRHEKQLAAENRQLEVLAMTDALTGLLNRRAFEEHATAEFSLAMRKQRPVSVLVMDLDDFKYRNDSFGHAAGDEALKVFASVLEDCVRTGDIAARIGGEEFALLLPETSAADAMSVTGRVHAMLRLEDHGPLPLTVSSGVATIDPAPENLDSGSQAVESWGALLQAADDAMYEAKRTGKNRAVHHDSLVCQGK